MGLGDLIDDEETEPEPFPVDKTIEQEGVVGDDFPREDVEYGVDYKCCPSCLHVGPKRTHRSWKCTNDDCGVSRFTMSFKEFRQRRWENEGNMMLNVDFVEAFKHEDVE